jgi:hypothetical protein
VSQTWFEVFIMLNILAIGAATGIDLETNGGLEASPWVGPALEMTSLVTMIAFTTECAFKLITEEYHPMR